MFRRLLTLHLILAVAAGPLLCCCTAGRVLASFLPTGPASRALSDAAPARVTTPCCAHKHQPAKPGSDQKPAPSKPAEKCPCQDDPGAQERIQTEVTSVDVSALIRAVTLDHGTLFTVSDCTSGLTELGRAISAQRLPNTSRLSTADLLFAHHNLRC